MKKKLLAFLLIGALVLSSFALVACGDNDGGGDAGETITLSFLNLNPESGPAVDAIVAAFMEENPHIIIEHEAMNSRQYDQRIQALAAADELPDIVTVQMFPQFQEMARAGLLVDLSDFSMIQDGSFDTVAKTALTLEDGFVYGLTWNNLVCGVFFNVDIFDELGLEIPKTFDEFVAVCEVLLENDIVPIASGLGDGWTSMYSLFNAGIQLVYGSNPDFDDQLWAGEAQFNSPEWIEKYTRLLYIYEAGFYGDSPMGGNYEQSLSDFATERAAMTIIGSWVIPVFQELNPELNFGMFPLPMVDNPDDVVALFESELGMGIAYSAPPEHREAALQFFEFFFSPEQYEQYLLDKMGFSAINGISVVFHDSMAYITENYADTGRTGPFMSRRWPGGLDALSHSIFQEIMMGTMTIEEGLTQMDEYFEEHR